MAIYMVDGDNNPKMHLQGIDLLSEKDIVHIFFSGKTTYYKNKERQKQIQDQTRANVSFTEVKSGKNAADFVIAITATEYILEHNGENVFMVSTDGHFNLILELLRNKFRGKFVAKRVTQIWEGAIHTPNVVDTWEKAHTLLSGVLGPEGEALFQQIRALSHDEVQPKSFLQRLFGK